MYQDLLPYRPAELIRQIMDFIHDDTSQIIKSRGSGIDHVAKNFCSHDHDLSLRVDTGVTREKTHHLRSICRNEVVEFLIRERLDRCCVEALLTFTCRLEDGELPHDRLSGSCRGSNQCAITIL